MRAREFIVKEQRTDEIAPVLAAAGGALARGAVAVGQGLAKGAQTVGGAVVKGVGNLASKGVQAAGQAVSNVAGKVAGKVAGAVQGMGAPNSSGQAVGSSSAPAGPTTGSASSLVPNPEDPAQAKQQQQVKQQQQLQAQQQKEFTTNIDKISAQLIAMKQDLIKQQQQPPQ
jgi:hypothetical protein